MIFFFFFFFLNKLFIIYCTISICECRSSFVVLLACGSILSENKSKEQSVNYENMRINFFKRKIASSVCVSNELLHTMDRIKRKFSRGFGLHWLYRTSLDFVVKLQNLLQIYKQCPASTSF